MITFPNAKINLGLYVTSRRTDGYHNLETIFYPIHLEDALEVIPLKDNRQEFDLKITGTSIDGAPEDNLVVRAYRLLKHDFDLPPIHIYMYKHIPLGAGLGGGSADGAFMLKLLNEKFTLGLTIDQLEAYAARLGADCPFFIQDRPVLATGTGNVFTPIDLTLKGMYIVLVKPSVSVSTREAYESITPAAPATPLAELIRRPIEEWRTCITNAFEPGVFRIYPEIAAIKDKLYDMGAVYASMTGSGSTVYGIFREAVPYVDEHFSKHFCRIRELE